MSYTRIANGQVISIANGSPQLGTPGTATILAGNTSVTVTHGVGQTPTWFGIVARDIYGSGFMITNVGALTYDIEIPAPQPGGNALFSCTAGVIS